MPKQDLEGHRGIGGGSIPIALRMADESRSTWKRINLLRTRRIAQRAVDVLVSAALLVLTFPVLLLSALAIRLEGPGPVFCSTAHVGHHGRPFLVWSLRTEAAASGASDLAGRVTIGQLVWFIRISQIPVLFSVALGDMTLVGPCPEPVLERRFVLTQREYRRFATAKPGLSGWMSHSDFIE